MEPEPTWIQRELVIAERAEELAKKLSSRAWIVGILIAVGSTIPFFFTSHGDWPLLGGMLGMLVPGWMLAAKLGARRALKAAKQRRASALAMAGKSLSGKPNDID